MRSSRWSLSRLWQPSRSTIQPLQSSSSRSLTTSSPPDDQTFSLPDGRILGYADYGSKTDYPLIYFHGFPTSRIEARGIKDTAHRHGIRVIAPDRPGYGLSTFQPHRRITDWPADVLELAQHLQLSRFAVVGVSGGGPYAMACANALPHETMSVVGIIAGSGPWEAGTQDLPWYSRALSIAVDYWPTGVRWFTDKLFLTLKYLLTTRTATKYIDDFLRKNPPPSELIPSPDFSSDPFSDTSIPARRTRLLRLLFEGFTQGSAAFVQEAQLLSSRGSARGPWGFRFEDTTYPNIKIYHGSKDTNAPVGMTRWMVKRLQEGNGKVVMREWEGDTHYSIGKRMESILGELVGEEEKKMGKAQ